MRKEVADLLRANKQENARIRVETVIRENLTLQVRLLSCVAPTHSCSRAHPPKQQELAQQTSCVAALFITLW